MDSRLASAFAAIDAANADDPNRIEVCGELRPKEQAHAEMACAWVERLVSQASDALLVAARAHHVRRWAISRATYPTGRKGYLAWRKALQGLHAETVGAILVEQEWTEPEIAQVRDLVRKRRLGRDPEAQALEDALCLIFLETQLGSLAGRLADDHTVDVLRKTLKKMSPDAIRFAMELQPTPEGSALLERAVKLAD